MYFSTLLTQDRSKKRGPDRNLGVIGMIEGAVVIIIIILLIVALRQMDTLMPFPDKKPWENEALMNYLKENPKQCSMKNYRVLQLARHNRLLQQELDRMKWEREHR